MFFTLFFATFLSRISPQTSLVTASVGFLTVYCVIGFLAYVYGRFAGYIEKHEAPQVDVRLAGVPREPFETYSPDRFRAAIERRAIRDSLALLFDSCRADVLSAPATGIAQVGATWNFSVGASWLGREKYLNKEMVRQTLTELSSLCAGAEQAFPESGKI